MDIIGTTLSNLIEQQFPEIYREQGPIFVAFIEKYFEWLESRSICKDEYFPFRVTATNLSANVVGFRTFFTSHFRAGDQIAICKDEQTDDYDIFTIKSVANNTFLTLTSDKLPNFSVSKALYSTVSLKPNAVYLTRNFFDIHDIDKTFDEYVLYFKEKYLKNIQFETITDTKTLVKHSLDLYRSKGTERAIDLLHKVVFGKPATVYYPKTDIFKLSSGEWYIPQYLELSLNPNNGKLINKQIVGTLSGAVAFVEEIIRRYSNTKIIEVAYISAISGNFISGEKITLWDSSLDLKDAPTIVGSLNDIEVRVEGTGSGFTNNELLEITSINGTGGKGKVLTTADPIGQLKYTLRDGGYGYANTIQVANTTGTVSVDSSNLTITGTDTHFQTEYSNGGYISLWSNATNYETQQIDTISSNTELVVLDNFSFTNTAAVPGYTRYFAQTFISEKVLRLSNVTIDSTYTHFEYFGWLDSISQPMAQVNYVSSTGDFEVGDDLFTWSGGNIIGTAKVLAVAKETISSGMLTISVRSGDMDEATIYTTGNAVSASLTIANGYYDITATANVIGTYANVSLTCNTVDGTFTVNEIIIQPSSGARGKVGAVIVSADTTVVGVSNVTGIFKDGFQVVGQESLATATIESLVIDVGLINISNTFYNYDGNWINTSYLEGYVTTISEGLGANVTFSNNLLYSEEIIYPTNFISDFTTYALNTTWPFTAYPTANLTTIIEDTFDFNSITIGKVEAIISFNPGIGYNKVPIIRLHEPTIFNLDRPDTLYLNVTSSVGFNPGELVTQAETDARGLIKELTNTTIIIQNLRYNANNDFVPTDSTATRVVGSDSGAVTNVISTEFNWGAPRLGSDIDVASELTIASGAITSIKVLDSGFGFVNGELVTIRSGNNYANGYAIDKTHGTGSGYYKTNGGFLSDDKKLSDGYYYQEYSYEVRSAVISDFRSILKDVVHVAGTKYFDALVYDTINTTVPTGNSSLTQNNLAYMLAIDTQPTDNSGHTNTGVTFSVAAHSTPGGADIEYQWQTNIGFFQDIFDNGIYSGVTTSTLTVTADDLLNNRQYRALIMNDGARTIASNPARLTVESWSPLSITNLLAWYSADVGVYNDTGITLALNGQEVEQWNDLSGHGYHLSRNGAVGPTFNATGLNGKRSIDFLADHEGLKALNLATAGSNKVSIFVVAAMASGTDDWARLISMVANGQTGDYDNPYSVILTRNASASQMLFYHDSTSIASAGVVINQPYRMGAICDGTNGSFYLNNVESNPEAMTTLDLGGPTNNLCKLLVGTSTQTEVWQGPISEIVIVRDTISADDLALLDNYFVERWGF